MTPRCTRQPGFIARVALLTLAALTAAGCEGPGFLAYVITGPGKVKARYTLEHRPTLVIVDDPNRALGDPNYPTVVGANVGFQLKHNQALPESLVVSQDRLLSLAARMGDDYATTPIDRIGARLDADQVIYILVRSMNMQLAPGYYKPTAVVEVKVIDTPTGKRLFPKPGTYPNPQQTPPGHTPPGHTPPGHTPPGQILSVEMKRQALDPGRRHAESMLARRLAERIGLEVAQLFYDHDRPDTSPGS